MQPFLALVLLATPAVAQTNPCFALNDGSSNAPTGTLSKVDRNRPRSGIS